MYSIDEIVAASDKLFGRAYTGALVEAALKASRKTRFTKEEADKIVNKFAERKIN